MQSDPLSVYGERWQLITGQAFKWLHVVPTTLQPYLRKIFEGINSLQFEKGGHVTAMISEEGEHVSFTK